MDRNDDGRISYDEFLNPPAADTRQARFDKLDRNSDGVVSRGEWASEAGVFHLADRNGDGVVTLREYLNAPAGETYELRFEQIDRDNDGVIGRREWPAGESVTFDRADRNNDGAVTRWEFANSGSAAATPAEMSFDDMDHNNDGVISRYEWHADRATFDRMDRNQDGIVTYREFQSPLPADTRSSRFQELDRNRDRHDLADGMAVRPGELRHPGPQPRRHADRERVPGHPRAAGAVRLAGRQWRRRARSRRSGRERRRPSGSSTATATGG